MNPKSGKGALAWIGMGIGGAIFALLVAQFFPTIIPASAKAVQL
jgi:hypothetical protein